MRIAYLLDWNPFEPGGVLNKINDQCNEWKKLGHDIHIFLIATQAGTSAQHMSVPCSIYTLPTPVTHRGGLYSYLNKLASAPRLWRDMRAFAADVVYYRQSTWYPGLVALMKAGKRCAIEINTDDIEEAKHYSPLKRWLHMTTRQFALMASDGIVTVTHELADKFRQWSPNIITIANGIRLPELPQKRFSPTPSLIFVASPGMDWHGTDKFIRLAGLLPQYEFHVVGPNLTQPLPPNVLAHGYLDSKSLTALYQKIHIGVGTLALHRKNMDEACPLKVREYVAHRMPIIIGYHDTDIIQNSDWALSIDNTEDNVKKSIVDIKLFIEKWKFQQITVQDSQVVDTSSKEKIRVNFFDAI
jgi:hypothetical protein